GGVQLHRGVQRRGLFGVTLGFFVNCRERDLYLDGVFAVRLTANFRYRRVGLFAGIFGVLGGAIGIDDLQRQARALVQFRGRPELLDRLGILSVVAIENSQFLQHHHSLFGFGGGVVALLAIFHQTAHDRDRFREFALGLEQFNLVVANLGIVRIRLFHLIQGFPGLQEIALGAIDLGDAQFELIVAGLVGGKVLKKLERFVQLIGLHEALGDLALQTSIIRADFERLPVSGRRVLVIVHLLVHLSERDQSFGTRTLIRRSFQLFNSPAV